VLLTKLKRGARPWSHSHEFVKTSPTQKSRDGKTKTKYAGLEGKIETTHC